MTKIKVAEFAFGISICLILLFQLGTMMPSKVWENPSTSEENGVYTEVDVDSTILSAVAEQYSHVAEVEGVEKVALEKKISDVYNSDMTYEQKKVALEKLGEVFIYEDDAELVASKSSDCVLNKPTISYNSRTKRYTVYGTGGLPAKALKKDWSIPIVGLFVGQTIKMGGDDGVALSITNLSGSTNGVAIVSGYGGLKGALGANSTSTSPVTENDLYGIGYEVQDKILIKECKCYVFVWSSVFATNTCNIQCQAVYNSQFANLSGSVKLFYTHTYKSTSVTGIGVNKTGINASWSSNNNKWSAYSYARTFSNGASTN